MSGTVDEYIAALLAAPAFARQVTGHVAREEVPAVTGVGRRPWPGPVLAAAGVPALYSHQALATDSLRAGRDVVVTTPTASGKTLIYQLPFLERFVGDPDARALFLFPLKALARDQMASFERLAGRFAAACAASPSAAAFPKAPSVAIYDGDTSDHFRRKIRRDPPSVLITNPDMLHLGILPHHEQWTTFLASLAFVVLDEAHTYRGLLGSHVALLLRRLERICARYSARPARVLCTATVGNPGELGRDLLGLESPPDTVCESGAPQGRRHTVFINPEDSPSTTAIRLLQAALARELRTIVYCRSRRMTELISLWASDKAGPYKGRISSYRAGFLPEERREIETRMASGELLAVVSTSALELGIDIGSLDVCILVGYPGTVMSMLQRGGRVGRKGQASALVLVAGEDALDQFVVRNPAEFFQRPPENAVLNPDNEIILARHLECAAAESPLLGTEAWMQRPAAQRAVAALERKGLLLRTAEGDRWVAARKRPQRDVELRGSGASFRIEDPDGEIIGSVDAHQAFRETHPGAVYLHRGRSYTIASLDLGAKLARAVPENVKWHTRVRTSKSTEILEVLAEGRAGRAPVFFGRLRVTEALTGYERRLNGSMRLLDIQPLDLPPQVFETEGFWITVPAEAQEVVENAFLHFMGSIHALEHVAIGLMPLLILADRNDFGGISIPFHAQAGAPAVFVYDGMPGGAGLTRSAFDLLESLLGAVRRTLEACPCESGCPSCIQSPKCGSGNRPLDKLGALALVGELLKEGEIRAGGAAPRPPARGLRPLDPAVGGDAKEGADAPATGYAPDVADAATDGTRKIVAPSGPVMVFDVETRRSAEESGGWGHAERMGVSVAVVWDGERFHNFSQDDLPAMFALLRRAGLVVGFNIFRFDYKVLQPFADYDLRDLPGLDLLETICARLSYRVSLDNLARATLDAPKTADGLQALRWWKEGRLAEIAAYCRADVDITRRLYEYGRENGYVLFTNKAGQKVRVPVEW